jgi:DNA (cytosine-5)-methyltransferase 1
LNPWDSQSIRQYDVNGVAPNINANSHGGQNRWGVCYAIQGNGIDSADTAGCNGRGWRENEMYTLNTIDRQAVCYPETARTLAAKPNGGQSLNYINPICYRKSTKPRNAIDAECWRTDSVTNTLNTFEYSDVRTSEVVVSSFRNGGYGDMMARDYKSASDLVVEPKQRKYIVRRLTPTECARLQGFPDWWCEGLGGSDSAIYKAYGNGMALPCAYDVLRRIAKEYDKTTL